ncbi:putative immunity protein [Myxococcus xanthus]|uniref:putative immunity protein n=1 Tax=Myxococcus xanthus TaxID=34 RepID=UPI001F32E0BC|nr:hypothetical protein [Myxococcus xanthus]
MPPIADPIARLRRLGENLSMPILPKERDPRLITIRRGGSLTDEDHHLLAEWAALCADHVLPFFESTCPEDARPRDAIAVGRAWIRGEVRMRDAHQTAFVANAAARGLPDPARFAALAAGQSVAVAHVAAHYLGAAAYAIRAAAAAASEGDAEGARLQELGWQRKRIPAPLRELVLEDQRARNDICWGVFTG